MGLTQGLGVAASYLKGIQFVDGLTLKIKKTPEYVQANEGFGFKDGPNAGKTVRFYFELEGEERYFDSTSSRFINALDPFKVGDTVLISRTGSAMKTEWFAKKSSTKAKEAEEKDVPFM